MHTDTISLAPDLNSFLKSLKDPDLRIDVNIECFINLLQRHQIRGSRQCAIATAHLLKRVVRKCRAKDIAGLIKRVQDVGQKLTETKPKELAIGNIIRRVLGVIREEAESDKDGDRAQSFPNSTSTSPGRLASSSPQQSQQNGLPTLSRSQAVHRPPLLTSHTSYAASTNSVMVTSMFNLLSKPIAHSSTPPTSQSPAPLAGTASKSAVRPLNLTAEVLDGIDEIIDELENMDEQIAAYATDHIASNEIILTYGASLTVQRFLLRAALKRKFTVIQAEGYPNQHIATHAAITGKHIYTSDTDNNVLDLHRFAKPLITAGITVILLPDSAIFALMSRVNKVIVGTHAIMPNGGLIAAAGTRSIALAAREHNVPVIVVSGVYKLCPSFIFDFDGYVEYGGPGPVVGYEEDGELTDQLDVVNPLNEFVNANLVDLVITNLGGHAPFSLGNVIEEQYRSEDIHLNQR